ncbi:PREDICTED: cytoplasmic tRNA 2-thiolation protein 2 [Tarenaya hassleriana]|uniref:cytoplasmic tRNA 2-thiolation protein 2 n=1 Tax=Tarenaya hassleriana TaxID=28532 RepID=UPI00053C797F|nr:PREDICTED: cytoplasmic tRNA 2-thiolation protein 2 [Tarenaya hassleriana]XP_010536130.1 PREDICTED: cytoplasmic tRNA 2-thiolation protein 2 [Tarenaya hassleriana]XP_010536131.1 PREDICTED: cytoplasmic tRNA 2-thiolation protein 2 [Tarenaya hassleriana]XP_010536132.1 PREDICTED: cytoplasmic tRNA 2-thiolation protein 2 [Tarenaya hassleriana]
MACNSSDCSSGCSGLKSENGSKSDGSSVGDGSIRESVCVKCKSNEPVFFADGASEDGKFCSDCFRNNVFGKFRLAVTCHAMITPSDKVLVAFSGGPSSRVALQFVHELQKRAQKNYEASRDRSLPVFGVGVVFLDETAIDPTLSGEINDAIELIRTVVSSLSPPAKHLHVVPIESVFGLDSAEARDRLQKLLDSVSDDTGMEDLLLHLRMLCLQKVASESAYNRLILGSCTSRIASHVLSATVKGRGYSLSADIQHVDARWKVPVVLPLRDCVAQELNRLCRLDSLQIVKLGHPHSGINGLVSSFVALLQEENPSRECTIVRTAGKLTPFYFNKIPEIDDSNVPLATRRRQKRFNLKYNEAMTTEYFCPICCGPLNKSDVSNLSESEGCQDIEVFYAACCSSCRFQILPHGQASIEQFYSLIPQQLTSQEKLQKADTQTLLREKIEDCLLSDGEEEI